MAGWNDLVRKGGSPQQATFLELFFDLAFIFVINRVTLRVTEHLQRPGAERWTAFPSGGKTLLLLMPLIWVWTVNAWTTARFDPRRLPVQALVIGTMFGVLVMSAALPTALRGGGMAFAGAYVAIQVGRAIVLAVVMRGHELHPTFVRQLIWFTLTGALWITGAFSHGTARVLLWVCAVGGDFLAARLGWPCPPLGHRRITVWAAAAGHLADRYRQFLLIALGESVLALALAYTMGLYGVASTAAFVIGFATTVLLWRIYFYRAGQILVDAIAASKDPNHLGRVAAFTHWIMIVGIIITAVGYDLVIPNPLGQTIPAWELVILGGPALFIAGRAYFEYVVFTRVSRPRVIGILALIIAAPIVAHLPPVLVALTAALILTMIAVTDAARARGKPLEAATPPR